MKKLSYSEYLGPLKKDPNIIESEVLDDLIEAIDLSKEHTKILKIAAAKLHTEVVVRGAIEVMHQQPTMFASVKNWQMNEPDFDDVPALGEAMLVLDAWQNNRLGEFSLVKSS